MFARLCAKALLLAAVAALVFFGIGLLGVALALVLASFAGAAGAYAIAGALLVLLALAVVGTMAIFKKKRPPAKPGAFLSLLLGAVGKDLPWAAVLSTALAGVIEMLRKRHRNKATE